MIFLYSRLPTHLFVTLISTLFYMFKGRLSNSKKNKKITTHNSVQTIDRTNNEKYQVNRLLASVNSGTQTEQLTPRTLLLTISKHSPSTYPRLYMNLLGRFKHLFILDQFILHSVRVATSSPSSVSSFHHTLHAFSKSIYTRPVLFILHALLPYFFANLFALSCCETRPPLRECAVTLPTLIALPLYNHHSSFTLAPTKYALVRHNTYFPLLPMIKGV